MAGQVKILCLLRKVLANDTKWSWRGAVGCCSPRWMRGGRKSIRGGKKLMDVLLLQ